VTGDEVNAAVSMAISVPPDMNLEGVGEMKRQRKELKRAASLSKPARNTKLELLIAVRGARESQGLKASSFSFAAQNPEKRLGSRSRMSELGQPRVN
jgi:hypothetical protein